jgi:hypothetical protein
MKVKVVTLSYSGQKVEFVVWAEQNLGTERYELLIPKIIYVQMKNGIVDDMALFKVLHVYRIVKSVVNVGTDTVYIRDEDNRLKEKLYELVKSNYKDGTGLSIKG